MRWLLLLAAAYGECAIIHGVVLERATQRPLARARVKLQVPVAGGGLRTVAEMQAGRGGNYQFPSLADGTYLVSATRAGYMEGRYQQTRPGGPGELIALKGDAATFAELRLPRMGAVTGRISDENLVGIADVTVIAYRAQLPLRIAGSGKSDDRGVYRIGRLEPGKYWVRTAPAELDDGSGLLPTFYPLSHGTRDARRVQVDADRDETDVDIQPLPGRLFSVSGFVQRCPPDAGQARVTISSDTGTKQMVVACETNYKFDGLSPNVYELYAEPLNSKMPWAAFTERSMEQTTQETLAMSGFPKVLIQGVKPGVDAVTLRRKGLEGPGAERSIWDSLGPGYWEVFVNPPAGSYFKSIGGPGARMRGQRLTRNDVAPEVRLDPEAYVRLEVQIAGNAAVVEGAVKQGGDPAVAAPVFLYPVDDAVRRRMHGYRTAFTGPKGEFRFDSVAPGQYLILATWDLDEINEESLSAARASTLTLSEGQRETLSLALWERR